ncbi:serine aminopeptidase domain-containing protein [Candidatus Auribacterota bacterium]
MKHNTYNSNYFHYSIPFLFKLIALFLIISFLPLPLAQAKRKPVAVLKESFQFKHNTLSPSSLFKEEKYLLSLIQESIKTHPESKKFFSENPDIYHKLYGLNVPKTHYKNGYFISKDSQARLYYQRWIPRREVKGILIITHGYSEHSAQYAEMVHFFVEWGFAIYSWDMEGHGLSDYAEGIPGHILKASHYVSALSDFFSLIILPERKKLKRLKNKDINFFGHSLGSLVTLGFYKEYFDKFSNLINNNLILSAPYLKTHPDKMTLVQKIITFLIFWLIPNKHQFKIKKTTAHLLARMKGYVEDDPLAISHTTANWYKQTKAFGKKITSRVFNLALSTFVLLAGEDTSVDNKVTKKLLAKIKNKGMPGVLEIIELDKANHNMPRNIGSTKVFKLILQQIDTTIYRLHLFQKSA